MGHGIHDGHVLWLMGDWVEVNAIIGTLDRTIEVEDVSMAHVHFANGALGSIVNSVLSPVKFPMYVLIFSEPQWS